MEGLETVPTEYRQRTRVLQVEEIRAVVVSRAEERHNKIFDNSTPRDLEFLQIILLTPQAYQGLIPELQDGDSEQLYQNAAKIAKAKGELEYIRHILNQLSDAVKGTSYKEIPLGISSDDVPIDIKLAFPNVNLQNEIMEDVNRNMISRILEALEKEGCPLLPNLIRDFAETFFDSKKALVPGELIGYLPTKIPGVELKYVYLVNSETPKLSLCISPLE